MVMELKIKRSSERAVTAAKNAFQQIVKKKYAEPYERAIKIGLAIDPTIKNIACCVYEKDGTLETLDYTESLAPKKDSPKKTKK
jgi:hypothetical protein